MPNLRDPWLEEWKTSAAPLTAAVDNSDARQMEAEAANSAVHSSKAEASSDVLKAQESSSFAQASQPAVVGSCVDRRGPYSKIIRGIYTPLTTKVTTRITSLTTKIREFFFRCS